MNTKIKYLSLFLILMSFLFMVGCGKPIMAPIQYTKPINFHVNKNALLLWEYGKQYSSTISSSCNSNQSGLVGALVLTAIESVDRTNNPSRYTLTYGKAEQAIFMTSLKNTLQGQVFDNVELITECRKPFEKEVLINVFFKTCRVSSPEKGFRITLTVVMTIDAPGKKPFVRSYLVQNQKMSASFIDQQSEVSTFLLENLISGIQEWQETQY